MMSDGESDAYDDNLDADVHADGIVQLLLVTMLLAFLRQAWAVTNFPLSCQVDFLRQDPKP